MTDIVMLKNTLLFVYKYISGVNKQLTRENGTFLLLFYREHYINKEGNIHNVLKTNEKKEVKRT